MYNVEIKYVVFFIGGRMIKGIFFFIVFGNMDIPANFL